MKKPKMKNNPIIYFFYFLKEDENMECKCKRVKDNEGITHIYHDENCKAGVLIQKKGLMDKIVCDKIKGKKCDCGEEPSFFHSKCCNAHFEGIVLNGRYLIACEICKKISGELKIRKNRKT
jgi:hypothetical protein